MSISACARVGLSCLPVIGPLITCFYPFHSDVKKLKDLKTSGWLASGSPISALDRNTFALSVDAALGQTLVTAVQQTDSVDSNADLSIRAVCTVAKAICTDDFQQVMARNPSFTNPVRREFAHAVSILVCDAKELPDASIYANGSAPSPRVSTVHVKKAMSALAAHSVTPSTSPAALKPLSAADEQVSAIVEASKTLEQSMQRGAQPTYSTLKEIQLHSLSALAGNILTVAALVTVVVLGVVISPALFLLLPLAMHAGIHIYQLYEATIAKSQIKKGFGNIHLHPEIAALYGL
jgi:hypothetical protein